MEGSLLQPPRLEHASTPPPAAMTDEEQEGAEPQQARKTIRWDLGHPYDRLMSRSQSREEDTRSRDPSPFSSTLQPVHTRRPQLTIVTRPDCEQKKADYQGPNKLKDCVIDVQSLPSGSTTATNTSTPYSALSKPDSLGKLRRPPLLRETSRSTIDSATSTKSSRNRWFGWLSSIRGRPDRPIPTSPTSPFHLPRRISRLPSFFTRERLYLPQHLQRRDVFLITITILFIFSFTAIGIFAAVRPQIVCSSKFLQSFVDALLPGLFIGAPYTMIVVAIAVSGWGKSWIKGRYTPLFYVLAATLGKVAVGALIANLDWTVLAC